MSLKKLAVTSTAAILLGVAAANADTINFSCTLGPTDHCTGTLTQSGSMYGTSGIDVFNDKGPYPTTVAFTLSFITTGAIDIDGTGADKGQNLLGSISNFSVINGPSSTDLSFNGVLTTLPPLVQAFLGSKTADVTGTVITSSVVKPGSPGEAASVDLLIMPVAPVAEPSSLLMFGSGVLAIGMGLHRKLCRK